MMNAWFPGDGPVPIALTVGAAAHTWSISAAVFCYLLFPGLAFELCRVRSRLAMLASGLLFLTLLLLVAFLAPRHLDQIQRIFETTMSPEQLAMSRLLSTRAAMIGGEISYSTYLLHPFVLGLLVHHSLARSAWPTVRELSFTMAVALAATYVVSYFTYRVIEVPSRRWLRSRFEGNMSETVRTPGLHNPELTAAQAWPDAGPGWSL